MKKCLIVALLFVSAVGIGSLDATPIHSMSYTPIVQDYCPAGYICEATNCTAVYWDEGYIIHPDVKVTGVSIYKDREGAVIAYVPGHGHLRAYKVKKHATGFTVWCIDVNGKRHKIQGYNHKDRE